MSSVMPRIVAVFAALDHVRPFLANSQSQPAMPKGSIGISRIFGSVLPNLSISQWYREILPHVRKGGFERESHSFSGAFRHYDVEIFLIFKIHCDAFL